MSRNKRLISEPEIQDIIGLSDENEIDDVETQVVKLEPQ